jgi:hypothetical protein
MKALKYKNIKVIPFSTDGMTDFEKNQRKDLIIKIRNYIDLFTDYEAIIEMTGPTIEQMEYKQRLLEKDNVDLTTIYEEILININRSDEYKNFMDLFNTSVKSAEFISNLLLGINITGLRDDILDEISEKDLKQLACEMSVSRYITPQRKLLLVSIKILLKKILASDLLSKHEKLKSYLTVAYDKFRGYLKRE